MDKMDVIRNHLRLRYAVTQDDALAIVLRIVEEFLADVQEGTLQGQDVFFGDHELSRNQVDSLAGKIEDVLGGIHYEP